MNKVNWPLIFERWRWSSGTTDPSESQLKSIKSILDHLADSEEELAFELPISIQVACSDQIRYVKFAIQNKYLKRINSIGEARMSYHIPE